MLYQNYRYNINFERSRPIKLRYIAIIAIALSLFAIYAKIGNVENIDTENLIRESTKSVNNIEVEQKNNSNVNNIAKSYNNIAPAAGNIEDIEIENAKKILSQNLLELSKKVGSLIKNNNILSDAELAIPVAENIPTPSPKPFTKIETSDINLDIFGEVAAKTITVSKGDSFGSILEKAGIGASKIYDISTAIKHEYDPKDMQIGQKITIYKKADKFVGLDIKKDLLHTIILRITDDGRYGVTKKLTPTDTISFVKEGAINSSLYQSAVKAGIPETLIVEMIRIYSWAVDFQRDIQSGDKFSIMYDMTITEDSKFIPDSSKILYVSLDLKNVGTISLYRYKDSHGDIGYFEEDGRSVRKALMKTPINGARLSSGFGMRRHPILGYSKMHKGIDFAAPRGTPIYAAGDGRIVYIGRRGGYGNFIKIRHHAGLETAYAHMKGFKRGLKRGSRVKQGQVIGYVGTTGRSTGPHLHYEVIANGRVVNPRKLKIQKGKRLAGVDLELFKGVVEQTKSQFVELKQNSIASANQAGVF